MARLRVCERIVCLDTGLGEGLIEGTVLRRIEIQSEGGGAEYKTLNLDVDLDL